jgi:hypothetical protein
VAEPASRRQTHRPFSDRSLCLLDEAVAAVRVVVDAVLLLERLNVIELCLRVRACDAVAERLVGVEEDLFKALSLENSMSSKSAIGGTAPERVREEISRARRIVDEAPSKLAD